MSSTALLDLGLRIEGTFAELVALSRSLREQQAITIVSTE
jgi:hypothetical protein